MNSDKKTVPTFTPEKEEQFLEENILGLDVSGVHACDHCTIIEFSGAWQLVIPGDAHIEWRKFIPQ